jgi:hypothetical protein
MLGYTGTKTAANLEHRQALGFHDDGISGLRIPAFVSFVAAHLKGTQAANLNPFASLEGALHAIEDRLDHQFGLARASLAFLGHSFGKARSGHLYFLAT